MHRLGPEHPDVEQLIGETLTALDANGNTATSYTGSKTITFTTTTPYTPTVTATVAALERAGPGHAYNIVDDEPVSFTQLIQAIAEAIGAPKPLVVPEWMFAVAPYARSILQGDMRVSNALAKSELGWQQAVPNYREGVARMAGHYAQAE